MTCIMTSKVVDNIVEVIYGDICVNVDNFVETVYFFGIFIHIFGMRRCVDMKEKCIKR